MNPAEALRLSRAYSLADKHGTAAVVHDTNGLEPPQTIWHFDVTEIAALIDEATAAKDATIAALRKELNDAVREAEREARDAYSQGQSDADEENQYRGYF